MFKVSVIILTKNRAELLGKALESVLNQTEKDVEIVVVNDGSTDNTEEILRIKSENLNKLEIISHQISKGITLSRQEALLAATGEYVAFLDDDDEWSDEEKLKKQLQWFERNVDGVIVGGGIRIISNDEFLISKQRPNPKFQTTKFRPENDEDIRKIMLFRNNFFTSTVMVKRQVALDAGGFMKDDVDLAEDYDLWLRIGKLGKMGNIQEVFTNYRKPDYNKGKFKQFLTKQLYLIKRHRQDYPGCFFASIILRFRLFLLIHNS